MTPELTYLAYTIVLYFVIILIQASAGIRQHGGLTLANSRDNLPPPNVYLARAKRNVDNMRENLWLFAPGVLIAAIAGINNHWTVLGAQIFFFARLAYSIVYLAGWPIIRPLIWATGVAGCVLIYLAIFGILA